jgi:acyl-CoA dehydrogenase
MIDFSLTPGQEEIRQKARAFALKEILPIAWYYDEHDHIPVHVLKRAAEAGIMNAAIPKEYGGQGLNVLESALITEETAAACPGLTTSLFCNSLGTEPIILSDNGEAKKKYLPKMANGGKLICFAASEPIMGSDVAGLRCKATPDGDDFILNGTKYWITNGGVADYTTVFATTNPDLKHGGICGFVVENDWEGVSVSPPIPKTGQRCSNTVGLNFKNVRVPKENVLAPPGKGFQLAMKTFSRTRPVIGAFGVGAARSAMEYALEYAKKRRAFGAQISNFEAIQFKLAEMFQKIETSRLLTWKAAWEADNGMDPTIDASIAKLYGSEVALEVVTEAMQIFGGYGYTKMFPVEKLFRDIRLLRIYEGTSEVQRVVVARHLLSSYKPVMPPLEDLPLVRDVDPLSEEYGKTAWRCRICGHVHYGDEAPEHCPYCFFPVTAFKKAH